MRTIDVLRLAVTALWQQKARTALTTCGVAVGSLVLFLSLSIGVGLQQAIVHEFRKHDALRRVEVRAGYGKVEEHIPPEELVVKGDMSEAKRRRLRERLVQRWIAKSGYPPTTALTPERIQAIKRWPHVLSVTPQYTDFGQASLGDQTEDVETVSSPASEQWLRRRLVAGDWFRADDDRSVVVSEYLLYVWGMASDEEMRQALGRKIRLEYRGGPEKSLMLLSLFNLDATRVSPEQQRVLEKVVKKLPALVAQLNDLTPDELEMLGRLLQGPAPKDTPRRFDISEELTIVGVVRGPEKDDPQSESLIDHFRPDADVILPMATAEGLYMQNPYHAERGIDIADIVVDREDHVEEVVNRVEGEGLAQYSLVDFAKRVQTNMMLLTGAMTVLALTALLVAALGITNTLVMSVMERTHEIGVMKAVGARDGQVLRLFLVEGTLIGLLGGCIGMLCGWLATLPGDVFVNYLVQKQGELHPEHSLFVFPWWLTLGVPLFAMLVTTLAAIYPARRAALVNPIEALRHE